MSKRTLKRQLNLFQVIMLGTAGTLGSGIFVLTGLAAGVAGPATFLAIIIGGLLSFSIALNYSELATVYPETGGAMTYVREAWGKGLLSFLIGSMDSISSTFYCALSGVGFAYSLSVFLPDIPIVPVAIAVILFFMVLNILGVSNVGNAQVVMGGILIAAFAIYIIAGFISPNGFNPKVLLPEGRLFVSDDFRTNMAIMMRTIALIYAVYVGFEVIADDAEEVRNPQKTIPIAILISIFLITAVYSLTVIVTLGTLPWQQLAGSETALSDAIKQFFPGLGVTIIGMAGMVGALTSINSSMLSATRETFTLSRDGAWPLALSRLNRIRAPFMAILFIGLVSVAITIFGAVEFLSFITSAGYLFVLFFSNLAMIQLHRKYPSLHRPFKAPLFPLTPILASITCIVVIAFSDLDALLFTGGIIALLSVYYYAHIGGSLWVENHRRSLSPGRWRIVVPLMGSNGSGGLMAVGSVLAEAEKDLNMCLLSVLPINAQVDQQAPGKYMDTFKAQRQAILEKFIHYAVDRNVPLYTKMVTDHSLADGIISEIKSDPNVKLVLMKCSEHMDKKPVYRDAIMKVARDGDVNLGVLFDRGVKQFRNIMVPVGGGVHSRMAIHLANDIALQENSHVDYFRVMPEGQDEEAGEDQVSILQEVVMTEIGQIPGNSAMRMIYSNSVADAVTREAQANEYDLIIIGASEELGQDETLFGSVVNQVAMNAPCSVLAVLKHESPTVSWLRHQMKQIGPN